MCWVGRRGKCMDRGDNETQLIWFGYIPPLSVLINWLITASDRL
jgi:hypothetical protein